MKNTMKRLLSVALALVLTLSLVLPAAAEGTEASTEAGTEAGTEIVTEVGTAEALAAAIAEGGNIKLTTSIFTAALTVAAEKTVTLDLNGHILSGIYSEAKASALITNNGTLVIKDSGSTGKLTSSAENPDTDWGEEGFPTYANNTITNLGHLTLLSGTIECATSGGACYAVDNNSGSRPATLVVEGGTIIHTANNFAVRMFCNSTVHGNTVNISGGTLEGKRAIWIQLPGSGNAQKLATVTITDGTLTSTDETYNQAIYCYSYGDSYETTNVSISGGTFNGDLAFGGGSTYGGTGNETVTVTGGIFNGAYGIYSYAETDKLTVSGGSFAAAPADGDYDDYMADGLAADVAVDGYYIVHAHDSEDDIPAVDATCTEPGLTAGKACSVCGKVMVAPTETPATDHNWSDAFQPGADTHWNYCQNEGCTAKKNEAPHTYAEQQSMAHVIAGNGCALQFIQSCTDCWKGLEEKTFWVVRENPVHEYDDGVITTPATCTKTGVKTYTCKNAGCGHTKTEDIPVIPHTEVEIPGKEATCTETGLTAGKKCQVCGTVTVAQTEVAAKGHKLAKVEAVAATYFAPGSIEHYKCDTCGKLFADEKGEKAITAAETVIAQLVKIEDKTAEVSTEVVENVIKEAAAAGKTEVVITVTEDELDEEATETVTVTKTQLPVAAVQQVAELHEEATLTVNMTNATVVLDKTTLDVVAEAAKTENTDAISLEIEHIETEELTTTQQKAVEDKKVAAVISASILVNDKEVHDFKGGEVTVAIPFTPAEGTKGTDYVVLYIADDGTVEEIPTVFANGTLVMTLSHFSEYVVVDTSVKAATNPSTGDSFQPMILVALMTVADAALVVLTSKKRWAK